MRCNEQGIITSTRERPSLVVSCIPSIRNWKSPRYAVVPAKFEAYQELVRRNVNRRTVSAPATNGPRYQKSNLRANCPVRFPPKP